MNVEFVNSKITGGHYAFANEGNAPFVNKMTEAMLVGLHPNDIVADIGAYIGEYSLYAISQGVKRVHSYEPTPETFKLLKRNAKPGMMVHNVAVVGTKQRTVELSLSKGIGVTNSIVKRQGKKSTISVMAERYENVTRYATVVKIDCEGAEYQFNIVQPRLRAIILEFHPIVGEPWQKNAVGIMRSIEKAGFKTLAEPGFKHGWDLHGAWVR